MRRWIMHVDMDAFYASVEQRDHPEWRGKPVIVGGRSRRGVVATASYEARAFGVHSAMPAVKARELCPDAIFTAPRFEVYKTVSAEIHEIMLHYAVEIEPLSLDEAFMDISGLCGKYETLGAVGRAIKAEIKEKTGLVASAGIAPNKFLAKLASDLDKPDGLRIIPYGKEKEILAPLPVRRIRGLGHVTARPLRYAWFLTIGDIQKAPFAKLASVLGNQASLIQRLSFGVDDRAVEASRRIKSIGDESTYEKDLTEPADIDRQIAIHSDVVAKRLRRHKLAGRTISLKVRFASFHTVTRSLSLEEGTDLQEEIYAAALELKKRIYMNEGVRLIGVTASNLAPPLETVDLFSTAREKQVKAAAVMDAIQEKFGEHALRKGFWLEEEKRKEMEEKENKEASEEE